MSWQKFSNTALAFDSLRLIVSLGMIRCEVISFDVAIVEKLLGEFGHELDASIEYYIGREYVVLEDINKMIIQFENKKFIKFNSSI